MQTIAKSFTHLLRTLILNRPLQPRKPEWLPINWAPLEEWQPAINRVGGMAGRRTAAIARRVFCAALFGVAVIAARPASAINGSFTNNGSGWSGLGSATNGSPHVVTNADGVVVLRIGADNGVKGAADKKVRSLTVDQCVGPAGGRCGIKFHADFTQVGTEKAKVKINYKNKSGSGSTPEQPGTIGPGSNDWIINKADECGDTLFVTFWIEGTGQISSTLDVSVVEVKCDSKDPTVLAMAVPQFGDPLAASYPLPLGGFAAGLPPHDTDTIVQRPTGLSPLANPFFSGSSSNSLDAVLPAADQTIFYKYDPQTASFDSYFRSAGHWFPSGGTFGPGDAAFIDSPVPQQFDFRGQYVPLPFGQHPSAGWAYFANPVDWPMLLEDVMGFKPVVGDVVVMFQHGDSNQAPPGTPSSGFTFQPDNFAQQPVIPVGETVQVFFADPSQVPIEIIPLSLVSVAPSTNILVTAPGGLPGGGVLQTADSLGANTQWKSLMGVADYYWEPATNPAHYFRLAFNEPTGSLYGYMIQTNGAPATGLSVQLAPNGATQAMGNFGQFSFFDVPLGLVDLNISAPVQVFDPPTGQFAVYTASLPVTVNLTSPVTSVAITENFTALVSEPPQPPTCKCKPQCGATKATINGVSTVVLGGGPIPNPCPDGVCTVTITAPGGVNITTSPTGRATFKNAANGVYKVTSTVCGITKTASVTVP
ncbi:MAG: hypothetical protein C5B50_04450 [Verrucomicrobia bacterium]|nr:MAG: hypothetical protein C5B50_04450 [Verrucomicrobiota bacterium]